LNEAKSTRNHSHFKWNKKKASWRSVACVVAVVMVVVVVAAAVTSEAEVAKPEVATIYHQMIKSFEVVPQKVVSK
jgi:anti-sigma-K factor RskA